MACAGIWQNHFRKQEFTPFRIFSGGELDPYLIDQARALKELPFPIRFRTINEFNAYARHWPVFGERRRQNPSGSLQR